MGEVPLYKPRLEIFFHLLAERYQIIAMELQAHVHTKDRDTPETFEQDASDVAELLNYLNISKADVFGFSNGGHTAMQMGISHRQKVNKLILASAFYRRDGVVGGFFEGLENANLANMPAPLKETYLQIRNDTISLQRMFDKDRARMLQFADWKDEE